MEMITPYTNIAKSLEKQELLKIKNALDNNEKLTKAVLDLSTNLIILIDLDAKIKIINSKACEILGYSKNDLIDQNFFEKVYPYTQYKEHYYKFKENMQKENRSRNKKTNEIIINIGNDKKYIKFQSLILKENDNITGQLLIGEDVTESRHIKETIEFMAYHDGLTKLPNRAYLFKEIESILEKSISQKWSVGMFFLDFDNFKACNDKYGHDAGDEMLKEISARLQNTLRKDRNRNKDMVNSDIIIRLGGDEFIVIINDLSFNIAQARLDSQKVASRIRDTFREPFNLLDNSVSHQSGVSIGISIFPSDSKNSQQLLKNSDKAMYYAKHNGKNRYVFYSDLKESLENE